MFESFDEIQSCFYLVMNFTRGGIHAKTRCRPGQDSIRSYSPRETRHFVAANRNRIPQASNEIYIWLTGTQNSESMCQMGLMASDHQLKFSSYSEHISIPCPF